MERNRGSTVSETPIIENKAKLWLTQKEGVLPAGPSRSAVPTFLSTLPYVRPLDFFTSGNRCLVLSRDTQN